MPNFLSSVTDALSHIDLWRATPLLWPTLVGVVAYFVKRRADELSRKRALCGEALAAALNWLEVPYRIRRREHESPEARSALAANLHEMQERLVFYQSWFGVEVPRLAERYRSLCVAAKGAVVEAAQQAWEHDGVQRDAEMNVGPLPVGTVADAEAAFVRAVRRELGLFRGLRPW